MRVTDEVGNMRLTHRYRVRRAVPLGLCGNRVVHLIRRRVAAWLLLPWALWRDGTFSASGEGKGVLLLVIT